VRNLLIDQKLERAALVESEEDAMRLMRGPLGSRKIVTAAWSTEGSKAYHRRAGPHCRTQLCVCSSPATIRDCAQEMCACCVAGASVALHWRKLQYSHACCHPLLVLIRY